MPRISSIAALLLACVGLVPAGAASDKKQPVTFARQFAVDVDASGQVTRVTPDPSLPAAVNEAIAAGIRKARFSAPMRNGVPVPGSTFLWTTACAVPEAGAYRMAVRVGDAGPAMVRLVLPSYPRDAQRMGQTANYEVEFEVQPDGVPALREIRRKDARPGRFGAGFEATLRHWVKVMRFQPERLDGQPVATRMVMPVEFTLRPGSRQGSSMSFDSKSTCELAMQARERSDAESRAVALDTPFRVLHAN